jgi:hypothetical protein
MAIIIEDGKGTGFCAGVTNENRFLVSAVSDSLLDHGTTNGNSYIIDTGIISLTSASESAVIYVKNNNQSLYMRNSYIQFNFGKSNSSGDVIVKLYTNPTGGTIISGGSSTPGYNRNISNSIPANLTSFIGSEGKTQIGGTQILTSIFQDKTSNIVQSGIIVSNGSSFIITVQPPTSNTGMNISINTIMVFFNADNI